MPSFHPAQSGVASPGVVSALFVRKSSRRVVASRGQSVNRQKRGARRHHPVSCPYPRHAKIAPETGPRFPRAGEAHSKRQTTPVAVAPGRLPNSGRRTPIDSTSRLAKLAYAACDWAAPRADLMHVCVQHSLGRTIMLLLLLWELSSLCP
jgi:hypothetical protein